MILIWICALRGSTKGISGAFNIHSSRPFELIWFELASIKINGIIIEFEDKLSYKRRSDIAAPDSYSIEWWKKLSEYANLRNIKISPLIQGLGHASFILKHDNYKSLRDVSNNDSVESVYISTLVLCAKGVLFTQ